MKKIIISLALIFLGLFTPSVIHAAYGEVANSKPVTTSSDAGSGFTGAKAVDGNNGTYWEGGSHAFPATLTIDLQAKYSVDKVTIQLPSGWGARTEGITVLGSLDNSTYSTVVSATNYTFGSQDITFSPQTMRYLRLSVSSNSAATAAQLSEVLVYGNPVNWDIRSVDAMKYTKDVVCSAPNSTFINNWLDKAVALGANYVAISTPYDNPSCASALDLTTAWVTAIRAHGLHVWHRHMALSFEGIYGVTKKYNDDYLQLISNYIINNPTLFADGDIFTPTPEPDSAGINGVTYCPSVCQFENKSDFNQWIRNAQLVSKLSFTQIGLPNMKIGYYGTNGFIVFGENNPDWYGHSFLEQKTVDSMGGIIAMDDYPETYSGGTMAASLDEAHVVWPSATFVIGEWGTITATSSAQATTQINNSVGAASTRSYVTGFNYWQPGPGGNEAILNSDFTTKPQFDTLKGFYLP